MDPPLHDQSCPRSPKNILISFGSHFPRDHRTHTESAQLALPIRPHAGETASLSRLPAAASLGCCLPRGCDSPLPLLAPQVSPPLSAITTNPGLHTETAPTGQSEQTSAPLCHQVPQEQAWSTLTNRSRPHRTLACSVPAVPSPLVQCGHLQVPGRSS